MGCPRAVGLWGRDDKCRNNCCTGSKMIPQSQAVCGSENWMMRSHSLCVTSPGGHSPVAAPQGPAGQQKYQISSLWIQSPLGAALRAAKDEKKIPRVYVAKASAVVAQSRCAVYKVITCAHASLGPRTHPGKGVQWGAALPGRCGCNRDVHRSQLHPSICRSGSEPPMYRAEVTV